MSGTPTKPPQERRLTGDDEPVLADISVDGAHAVSESLSHGIYEEVRRRIIVGDFAQGIRLPEQRLADDLFVSRIPLREALYRLAADGFIESRPRRSAVVVTWTPESVHHLFDARLALETSAAGNAARRGATGADLGELDEALERSETEMTAGDELGFADANVRFHRALVAAAGNPLVDALMRTISGRMAWLFYLTAQRDHEVACREHRAIVDAVRGGNPQLAETLTYSHIEVGRAPSLADFRGGLTA